AVIRFAFLISWQPRNREAGGCQACNRDAQAILQQVHVDRGLVCQYSTGFCYWPDWQGNRNNL
ncbi:MAG TPA: hypothetical protein VLH60_02780, partial [Sedimentisphaerales bacterium]|nr:hypothetical protein [Sedimentisphaerales bacterium]